MAGLWLGAAGDATAQEERGFTGRCKCLDRDQLRTKERCDSKAVVLEEVVVLHGVNLREGTDQRGGDPRIKSIEWRLSPEALRLEESVQVSLFHSEPLKKTVQTLPKPSYAAFLISLGSPSVL